MNQELIAILDYMEKEKGIDKEIMLEAIKTALISAARKSVGPANDLDVQLDPRTLEISAHANLRVVNKVESPYEQVTLSKARRFNPMAKMGDLVKVEVTPKDFGRIAAQVFKQTIHQNIRGIEKDMIFEEFKDREGDIIHGTVRRFERSDVVIDLGKFEATMPSRERVPTEDYSPNERIRGLVLRVDNNNRGPEIVISRSHPDFVRKLFELEVNELHDGTVEIKALAREAGYRTKIAVASNDPKVDPVGACVGMRGVRVKNIVRELNNEKIDLFRWSDNIKELVVEALKPAKLRGIEVDEEAHRVKVYVDEENLSLAIGRRGQNARLTSKLTGWEIDIVKDEEKQEQGFAEQLQAAVDKLAESLGIENEHAEIVVMSGFGSLEGLREATEGDLRDALPEDFPDDVMAQIVKAGGLKSSGDSAEAEEPEETSEEAKKEEA